MAGSLRRPGQVLLADLKEVQLFKKDPEIKKIMVEWNKARSSFLNPWLKIIFFAAPLYFFYCRYSGTKKEDVQSFTYNNGSSCVICISCFP